MNKSNSVKVMQLTLVIIAMALAYFTMPAAAETNLIANWTFNEDAGIVAADSSGNANNVTLMNGPIWTTGVNGNALQFDGTNDYVVNTSAAGIPAESPFSVVAWVNGKGFSNPRWNDIVRKEGSWAVQITPNNKLNLEITAIQDIISDIDVPTNVWTHIAVTFEGTTVKFYMNGVLGDTRTQTNVPDAGLNTIEIGGYTSWGTYLDGALDEVKIYNRTLNATEINADYLNSSMSTIPASAPKSLLLKAASEPTPAPTSVTLLKATAKPTPAPTSVPLLKATAKSTPAPKGKLIFDGSFSQGDHWTDIGYFSSVSYGNDFNSCLPRANSLQVVDDPLGQRGLVGRFSILHGDSCNSGTSDRAMLTKMPYVETEGADRYYSVSVYLAKDFPDITKNEWVNIWEIMSTKPEFPYNMIFLKSDASDYVTSSFGSAADRKNVRLPIRYQDMKGKWTDFIVHVKWSATKSGQVDVWYKFGTESTYNLAVSNHAVRTTDGRDTLEIPVGVYRNDESNKVTPPPRTLYITGVKIGTTRADVEYKG